MTDGLTVGMAPSIIKCMVTQTKADLRLQAIKQLCQCYHVVVLYVFGSQATAVYEWATTNKAVTLQAGHDVDIGIKVQRGHQLTPWQKVAFAQAMEEMLAVSRVDLVSLDDADPFLAANIIRGERLYAADSYVADEYELYVLRRAGDLAPFEKARLKMILEGQHK